MLTLTELNQAVSQTIAAALSETAFHDVEVFGEDAIAERPYIKVLLSSASSSLYNTTCRERTLLYKVSFYARNPEQFNSENLEMQDIMERTLLGGLSVEGVQIPVQTVLSKIEETVLTCSVELTMIEVMPDVNTSELTEELQFREVIKE
jgi:hypothetical protein